MERACSANVYMKNDAGTGNREAGDLFLSKDWEPLLCRLFLLL